MKYIRTVRVVDGEEGVECSVAGHTCKSPRTTNTSGWRSADVGVLCTNLKRTQRFRFLRAVLAFGQRKGKHAITLQELSDDTGSDGTDSTALGSSDSGSVIDGESLSGDWALGQQLIEKRLLETGVVSSSDEYELVPDYVSKEMVGLFEADDKKQFDELHEGMVEHVKTGVWQVQGFDDDGSPQQPFYVVTGVAMDDRVDTKKLRKAIFAGESHAPNKRRPKIGLAPTEIGEELTGFKSGTMMPICHSVDMKLYLEETIANQRDNPQHRILCGSGMFGKCLSIPTEKFVQIAERSARGMTSCSLIQKRKAKKYVAD